VRKRFKRKLRSCPMCKPHKTNGSVRWKPKDLEALKIAEKEIRWEKATGNGRAL